jgi:hypothetical protein
MKKAPAGRHFPYKHPTFGTVSKPAPVSKWKSSVYYWWWEYLRRNPLYLQTCASEGQGPCIAIYADFGDVRGDDFKLWWSEGGRGVRLFAEPRAEDMVRVLKPGDEVLPESEALTISLPLDFPKRLLESRFRALLAEVHAGAQGKQYAKRSSARYKVVGQPNIPALALMLEVWDLRQSRPDLKLWELGNRIPRVAPESKIKGNPGSIDNVDRKAVLASTVSRYLKKAQQLVIATGEGRFV